MLSRSWAGPRFGLREPRAALRKLVPFAALKHASAGFWGPSAPLLEKERDTCGDTLVAHVDCPRRVHWSRMGAALAADDDPIDAMEVEASDCRNQRFYGQEAHGRVRFL